MVASFTDAWIETLRNFIMFRSFESHLLQMRGLKQRTSPFDTESTVASFTDAWIETGLEVPPELRVDVASFTDAWIETWI